MTATSTAKRVAIADIGSNSARMVVVQRSGDYGLVPVSESKVLLRLQREVGDSGELTPHAMKRLISVVKDFRLVAASAGADDIVAVATSAIRNTADPDAVVRKVHEETGVEIRVMSGEEEAAATFKGAISSLPIKAGVVIDIGGGSMEIVEFSDRRAERTVTLPLGALKLGDRFLTTGSVSSDELDRLSKHVRKKLSAAGIDQAKGGIHLVGTGGTVRNAGKIDRRRTGKRFGRLHGHSVDLDSMEEMVGLLSPMTLSDLRQVPGLNPERSDSIVGGLAALAATIRHMGGDSLLVSGAGLREGLALEFFGVGNGPSIASSVQSVRDMCRRFATWEISRAERRARIAAQVLAAFEDTVSSEAAEAVTLASELVDAGSAIDYYQRYASAALVVVNSNAGTLTHRQIALVSAVCMAADGESVKASSYGGEIKSGETEMLRKAGVLLRLSDEIEMRLSPVSEGVSEETVSLVRTKSGKADVRVSFQGAGDWEPSSLLRHYKRVLGGSIELAHDRTG